MNKRTIGFFILCLVVGVGIVVQAKVTNGEHAYVSAKVLVDNEITMKAEREEIQRVEDLIQERKATLEAYRSGESSTGNIVSSVEDTYDHWRMAAGFTKVQGPGIAITLDDGARDLFAWENANDIIVHDLDLLMLIEALKTAGAEAISINGERYMSGTEIACAGHTVNINGKTYARPFRIDAIGDPASLSGAMTLPGSYGSLLVEYGLIFRVDKKERIVIPAYSGSPDGAYMETIGTN